MISKLERRKLSERRKRKPHAATRALPPRRVGISWPVGIHGKPPLSAASGPVHRCATGRHQLTVRRRRQAVGIGKSCRPRQQERHVGRRGGASRLQQHGAARRAPATPRLLPLLRELQPSVAPPSSAAPQRRFPSHLQAAATTTIN
jgi:hypothetical protein